MAPSRKPRGRPAVLSCNKHDSGDCHRISTRSHPALHSDCDKVAIGKRNGKAKPGPKPQPAARSTRRKDPKVEALVYRFLGNLAAIESDRRESIRRRPTIHFSDRNTRGTKRRPHSEEQSDSTRRLRRRRFRSPTPYSWDRVSPDSTFANSLLNDEPNLMLDSDSSADEDDENPTHRSGKGKGIRQQGGAARRHQMQIARSLQLVSSTSELLNQQPTTQADRNLLQRIHQYLSDGIAEGRRRAQRYVRKALLFALDMGYLSFADREGKLLRVSPDLKPGLTIQPQQQQQQQQQQHSVTDTNDPNLNTNTTNTTNASTTSPKVAPPLPSSNNLASKCDHSSPKSVVPKAPAGAKSTSRKRNSRAARLHRRRNTRATGSRGKKRPNRRTPSANKRSGSRARAVRRRLRAKSLNGNAAAAARSQRKRESSLGARVTALNLRRQNKVVAAAGNDKIKNCSGPCRGVDQTVSEEQQQQQQQQQEQQQNQQSMDRPSSELRKESSRQASNSRSSSRCACKDNNNDCNNELSSRRSYQSHGSRGRQNSQLRDEPQQSARDRSKSISSRASGQNQDSQFAARRSNGNIQDF